ncbi:MAG: 5-(carboxyamino)imidazole ribonucleotide synthase [Phycisphaerales bacterium JB052]
MSQPLVPVERVGIIGGGQLAQMLAQSVQPLGVRCTVLDPNDSCCANSVCEQIVGEYDDPDALRRLADCSEVVTYEFENVPATAAEIIRAICPIHPNPDALGYAQDRHLERGMFSELGIAIPNYRAIDDVDSLQEALSELGTPAILKARTLGYDGKGQVLINDAGNAAEAFETIGSVRAILDQFVEFARELSIVATRSVEGDIVYYPLSENVHRGGILRVSKAPARDVSDALTQQARNAAKRVLERFDYVGTLAVEFFQIGSGDDATLVANEIAPRVHNTGHWTIEGAQTSQFENHMRAVMGMKLGSAEPIGCSAMVNIIGDEPRPGALESMPEAHVHMYGKAPRAGRKIGHVTLNAPSEEELDALLERFTRVIG